MNIRSVNSFFKIIENSKRNFYIQVLANILTSFFELINVLTLSAIAMLITDFERFGNLLNSYVPNFTLKKSLLELSLTYFLIVFFFIFVVTSALKIFLRWISIYYNLKIEKDINNNILRNYLNNDYLSILKIDSFKLFNILNYQVSRFVNSLVGPVCTIINSVVFLLSILLLMFYFSGLKILFLTSLLFLITFSIYLAIRTTIQSLDIEFTLFNLSRQSLLNETVYNIKYLKLAKIYEPLIQKFKKINDVLVKSIAIRQISMHVAKPIIEIFFLFILTFYFLFSLKNNQVNLINILPELSFYLISFYRIIPSVQQIYQSGVSIKGSKTAFNDILDKNINFKELKKNKIKKFEEIKFKKKISLEKVYFKYTKTKPIFKNLNTDIHAKKITCIYGPSGVGKSTLTDIIMGLVHPTRGNVKVDGKKLNSNNIDSWHDSIGYVGQSFYLLNESILKNIIFRSSRVNYKKAEKVAKIFFSSSELKNLLTKKTIGENGKFISFGQKQRLVLSRLIYQNKDIIILDEPTSNLDNVNADIFFGVINRLKRIKTVIIISHDERIKKYSDKIINLKSTTK